MIGNGTTWACEWIHWLPLCYQGLSIVVIRFTDRDLLLRFHWGLGVGHYHAHGRPPPHGADTTQLRGPPSPSGNQGQFIGPDMIQWFVS